MNGTSQPIKDYFLGDFWKVNLGHAVAIIVFLGGLFITYGRLVQRFDEIDSWRKTNDQRMEKIDTGGTTASRQAVALLQQIVTFHEARIQKTEDAVAKIGVLGEKIDHLTEDVKSNK